MKKLLLLIFMVFIISCNSWKTTAKNIASEFSLMDRTIKIYNSYTGEIVWEYSGNCYISGNSSDDVSIIYYTNGISKKMNIINSGFFVLVNEN